jgi:RNase P protein component
MKEAYRSVAPRLKEGFDILFIARNTIVGAGCREVTNNMTASLTKGKRFK